MPSRHRWRMKKVPKTAEQLNRHAALAAALRYGVTVTDEFLAEVLHQIQDFDGRQAACHCVERQSHSRSIWEVTWEGQKMRVVYDKLRKCLVTFLPLTDTFEFPWQGDEEVDECGC